MKKEAADRVAAEEGMIARYVDEGCLSVMQKEIQPFGYSSYHAAPTVRSVLNSVYEKDGTPAMQCVMHHLLCRLISSFDVQNLPFLVVPEVAYGYVN
ncbi:MAG: hypothetical protein RIC38_15505, partial [Chromatocurvus sp.]